MGVPLKFLKAHNIAIAKEYAKLNQQETGARISFTVTGEPQAMQRARVFRHRYTNKIMACTPKESRGYKERIAECAKLAGVQMINCPVTMRIKFYLPRPKYLNKKSLSGESVICDNRPDIDNFCKAVLDALNGIAYKDDGQVWELQAQKHYHEMGGQPRTFIEIW